MPQNAGINFVPATELKQTVQNPYVLWFFKTGVYFLLVTYVVVLGAYGYRWFNEFRLGQLNASIKEHQATIASNKQFMAEFEKVRNQFKSIGSTLDFYKERNQYLTLIEQTIPQPATLVGLTIENGVLTVEGVTNDYLSVNQWQYTLEKSDLVNGVTLREVERNLATDANDEIQTNQVTFSFEVALK